MIIRDSFCIKLYADLKITYYEKNLNKSLPLA